MKLRTIQIAKRAKCKNSGTEFVDVSIKSGLEFLAPTKKLLYDYKYRGISEDEYCIRFVSELDIRYKNNPSLFVEFCLKPDVTIGCYCRENTFCHRYILVEYLKNICEEHNIEFEYLGEY